jgi:hypothetical protein
VQVLIEAIVLVGAGSSCIYGVLCL